MGHIICMVSDGVFYGVLITLIVLVVILIIGGIFFKVKYPIIGTIMMTLHASLFGYETAMIELIGPRGYKTHVFPIIVDSIKKMEKKSNMFKKLMKSKDIYESMQNWMKILKASYMIQDGHVVKHDDNSFSIVIPHCLLCHPIHDLMGDQKGICPMALILSAAGTIADDTKEASIEYSQFSPTGTVTKVIFS